MRFDFETVIWRSGGAVPGLADPAAKEKKR